MLFPLTSLMFPVFPLHCAISLPQDLLVHCLNLNRRNTIIKYLHTPFGRHV